MTRSYRPPIDRGWAWVVLAACTVEFFIMVGFFRGFGILFVEYIERYDTSSSDISIVLAVQTVFSSVSSVIALGIGTAYFTTRTLVISGAVMLATSQLCNAFAPSASFLIFSQGFIFGTGAAFMHGPSTLMLSHYFDKRIGLSNSVANIGGSMGGLVFPLCVRFLIDKFELSGCLILLSAMFLHGVVCGALMRPLDLSKYKDIEQSISVDEDVQLMHEYPGVTETTKDTNVENNKSKKDNGNSLMYEIEERNPYAANTYQSYERLYVTPKLHHSRRRTLSENNSESVKSEGLSTISSRHNGMTLEKNLKYYRSFGNGLGYISTGNIYLSNLSIQRPIDNLSEHSNQCNDLTSKLFDCSLFRNALFRLFMVFAFLTVPCCALPVSYIPPFAKDCGISDENIALIVMISSVTDLISRSSLAFIADTKKVKRHVIVACCLLINASASMFSSLYTTFATVIIFAVTYGLFGGIYFSLYPVIIIDFIGADKLQYGLAMASVIMGISVSINSVVIGFIRDMTHTYVYGFYLIGISGIVASVVMLVFEPICRRTEEQKTCDN